MNYAGYEYETQSKILKTQKIQPKPIEVKSPSQIVFQKPSNSKIP
jgi:hypothetical protein